MTTIRHLPSQPVHILFAAMAFGSCAVAIPVSEAAEQPNILWIIAEDMSSELGCYGADQVWTPVLDQLARQGVRYTHAFATAPVCSASRSAFMTGMYQTTIGAHHHRSHRSDDYRLPEGVRLLTHRLRDAGYFTVNVRGCPPAPRATGKEDWNFQYGEAFDSKKWNDLKSHQPFYAQVNFPDAHRGKSWPLARKKNKKLADPAKVKIPPYYPDHPITRDDWANYLDSITQLDRQVGDVLARLKEDGLADNTIVFFFGDHGRCMVRGKQWCYDSGLRVPLLIRWPKSVPVPEGFTPRRVSDELVSLIDLTATTLSLAGVKKPPAMQGRVFLGPEADPPRQYVFAARDRCDETTFRIRTVRDKRYRYIRNFMPERPFLQLNRYKERSYPVIGLMRQLHAAGKLTPVQATLMAPRRPAEELYDTVDDPYEVRNLADEPDYQNVLKRMRGVLDQWIEDSDDQGRFPEDPEVVEYYEERMRKVYDADRNKAKKQ